MDIPETGAVFAFGRSHLTISGDGNDNNYFFIKKDRVKRLICGRNQSAVICDSGRLFVWGENPCGQLAIGTCENIITKPSCVKHIKQLGHTVKDFQYGLDFSVLLTDSNKVFYAGKNIFPFNAKIESLSDKFRHGITETPVELEEFSQLDEDFELIRTGDEHFVLLSVSKRKLCGWGFNSHHQLAMIDSYKVLRAPDVFFETEDDETIKFIECGKLSTCVVTEFNDLFIVGKFGSMTISTFTKIRQPIANTNISQLYLSDDDEIYLVTESGLVFKSNDFRNIMELQFDEFKFSNLDEKILKIAPGENFASIITESGRCFSLLKREKTLIESSKLKNLRVVDVNAGSQHVVVSAFRRIKDMNGNHETLLNQTYTINFKPIKGVGSGEENYQEPDTGENLRPALNSENISRFENEDKVSLLDLEESPRNIGSRATTLECKDTDSSGNSSSQKVSPNRSDSTIRFIDNGIDKTLNVEDTLEDEKLKNGSVKIVDNNEGEHDENGIIDRKKTPMPRSRRVKIATDEDLDESGIIDRDEDLFIDDDDDVSTSTLHGSEESLKAYIKEENKINEAKANGHFVNGKMKWKKFVSNIKDKGKGLSCKNADNVIAEDEPHTNDVIVESSREHSKSCSIM